MRRNATLLSVASLFTLAGLLSLLCPCAAAMLENDHSCCEQQAPVLRALEEGCCAPATEAPRATLTVTAVPATGLTVAPLAVLCVDPQRLTVVPARPRTPTPALRI